MLWRGRGCKEIAPTVANDESRGDDAEINLCRGWLKLDKIITGFLYQMRSKLGRLIGVKA